MCAQANLPKVDFIKANVPQAEPGLLLHAFGTLLRDRPTLLLCIGPGGQVRPGRGEPDVVRSLIRSLAYGMYRWQGGDWRSATSVAQGEGRYLFRPYDTPMGPP